MAAVAVAVASGNGGAAEAPAIRVSVPACSSAPFSVEAFLGSLAVELAGHVPACCLLDQASPPAGAEAPAGLRVTLSIDPCDERATSVDVRVHDAAHASDSDRRVGLGDIPLEARPRALALAVAELVHSATASPPPAPAPNMTAPGAAPTTASFAGAGASGGTAPRPRVPWIFVSGMIELETHPGNNMTLWGLRPSVAVARGPWQAALDVDAMIAEPSVPLGDVSTHLLAGTLAVGPRLALGHSIVDLAACGRFGWAWMAGRPSDPNAVSGSGSAPVASAGGRLGILVPTAAKVSHLRALVEAGAMIHGLDAAVNGTTSAGLTGGYVLFAVGFGENR